MRGILPKRSIAFGGPSRQSHPRAASARQAAPTSRVAAYQRMAEAALARAASKGPDGDITNGDAARICNETASFIAGDASAHDVEAHTYAMGLRRTAGHYSARSEAGDVHDVREQPRNMPPPR